MVLVYWLIVGLAAGWLAGKATGTERGLIGNLVLGLIGSFVAGFFSDSMGGNLFISVLVAAVFATILVLVKNMLFRNQAR